MNTKLISKMVMSGALLMMAISANAGGGSGVAPVNNTLYAEECGTCHFAYQPGLLPERSWRKLMAGLDDHFDENAELDEVDRLKLENYLVTYAGDHSNYKRSKKLMRSIRNGDAPLRITMIPYLKKEHREVPKDVLKNEKIRSLSNCDVCHRTAQKGDFEERGIDIPGYGKWED
ncbi:MAG: diheme cytochrome c [Gammaproteobacteria bacterium]|nr:diheme cytochrome c [Gammaproteobacteria bacterium]